MTHPFANIDFLYELGELREIKRRYFYGHNNISVAEHTLRVTYIALILAKQSGANIEKTLQMALVHDVPEIRTGDPTPWQKPYVQHDEKAALHDMLEGTALEHLEALTEEYVARQSLEAQIVKDADMIDTEMELREMRELGSNCLDYFEKAGVRDQIEARLRTEVGKALMHQLRQRNPFDRALIQNSSVKNNTHGK